MRRFERFAESITYAFSTRGGGSIPMHLRQFDLRPFNGSGIKIRFISIDER